MRIEIFVLVLIRNILKYLYSFTTKFTRSDMQKYGLSALQAVKLVNAQSELSPIAAWRKAVQETFPTSESSCTKGCPKGAFLGLCEEGCIKGIPAGAYTKSTKNKNYALKAIALLRENPNQSSSQLWNQISDKKHNSQMDVALALFKEKCIIK
jgi:hypothetical protein